MVKLENYKKESVMNFVLKHKWREIPLRRTFKRGPKLCKKCGEKSCVSIKEYIFEMCYMCLRIRKIGMQRSVVCESCGYSKTYSFKRTDISKQSYVKISR